MTKAERKTVKLAIPKVLEFTLSHFNISTAISYLHLPLVSVQLRNFLSFTSHHHSQVFWTNFDE